MKTLIVIDMQNDFIDGSLGTKEAQAIIKNVKNKIEEYRKNKHQIIFTRDTHKENYLESQEGKNLPVIHCVEGTLGWEVSSKIGYKKDDITINKVSFGHDWSKEIENNPNLKFGDKIEIIGLCTDICVISNALTLKAIMPEKLISVDKNCCAGVSVESHNRALEAMRMCQINIIG